MTSNPPPGPRTDQQHAHFATRLRQWRADRGLMLKQVATEFGVAEATWSRWEKQERFPSPAKLRQLAEFIGVLICCIALQPGMRAGKSGHSAERSTGPAGV